jgi:hypothetical protein
MNFSNYTPAKIKTTEDYIIYIIPNYTQKHEKIRKA